MSAFDRLTEQFRKFPGIGPRQAQRFVYYLLRTNQSTISSFIHDIQELRKTTAQCIKCQRHFTLHTQHAQPICEICSGANRDSTQLMIVNRDTDLHAIESYHVYNGLYFVLGGTLTFNEQNPERRIQSTELVSYIKQKKSPLKEIIIATNANPEGEHTAHYITDLIHPLCESENITITTLGRGLSTGLELEYSDESTLKSALTNRTDLS